MIPHRMSCPPATAAALAILLVACNNTSGGARPDPGPVLPAMPEALPAPAETTFDHIDGLGFADAVAYAKPMMGDTFNDTSKGALLLGLWSATHLRWADVSVANNETSPALVKKDSDAARGRRLCTSGQIVQIKVEKLSTGGKVGEGLLMSDSGNIYSFITAGSSGSLVEQSWARMCGVIAGTYDYSNSGGGTGHAVSIVGMFDLPENKPKK